MNFTPIEILDLIAELGQTVEFCTVETIESGGFDFGMPNQQSMSCRPVPGYVVPSEKDLSVANSATANAGSLTVYLSADAITRQQLDNPSARIRWNGKLNQFEYGQTHVDRGIARLHQLECA